jgi:inosine/xanthosine triphosphatase
MTTIIVASTNPVKIAAVKNGFRKMFSDKKFNIEGISVSSSVSHQPRTNVETEKGAVSRVENAKKARPDADYWVGIEGGTSDLPAGRQACQKTPDMEAFAWVVIESKEGQVGKGKTGTFLLPPKVAKLIHMGKELGEADDIVFGQTDSKQKMGAVGLLTNNVIDRTTYYTHAVILALIRFKNEKIFHN